ncbi:MAG: hypothetical protein IKU48_04630 [Clostridia bacterium]|nr:hypothetical protein [Clostridia bacterium]
MKRNFLKSVYGVFQNACVIFTIFVLACSFISFSGGAIAGNHLNISALLLLALLALWLSLSSLLLKPQKINIILRVILNFVSSVVGMYVILFGISGASENQAFAFTFTIVFSILYVIVTTIILTVKKKMDKKKTEKEN